MKLQIAELYVGFTLSVAPKLLNEGIVERDWSKV